MTDLEFVALDVETANRHRGSVCAIGLAVVRDGAVAERYHWLSKPPASIGWFDGFNVGLHGITPADVEDELPFHERLNDVIAVVGDRPVVAHNAAFDIGALREGCTANDMDWPTFTYGCSLVMSRRALQLVSYRLPIVATELGVARGEHHQAGDDAAVCAGIVLELASREGVSSFKELADALHVRLGHLLSREWYGCVRQYPGSGRYPVPPGAKPDADPDHPLYGQVVVFTGGLTIRRVDAWELVAELGATPEKGVTKRTTLLVVGDGFTGNTIEEFHTGKAAVALKWMAKGHAIEVLTEPDFLQLLADTRSSGHWSSSRSGERDRSDQGRRHLHT